MAYNHGCDYTGSRFAQFILTVIILLGVGLIHHKNGYPLLVYGIIPIHHQLSFVALLFRVSFAIGSLLLYPILSLCVSCGVLCATKIFKPHIMTLCLDALGIIIYFAAAIIFGICIKENKSLVIDQIPTDSFPGQLFNFFGPVLGDVSETLDSAINDGIDRKIVNNVMIVCVVYFAIQVVLCAYCIYLATVYKNNNRNGSQLQVMFC